MAGEDIEKIIMQGVVFRGKSNKPKETNKIKTKAKKKTYITGAHKSASAKMKADIRHNGRGYFFEVPGGFEPPCMVLQTSDSTTHPRHRVLLNAVANVQHFF